MKDKCLNCGEEVEIEKIFVDELGSHTICPDCGGSFDVNIEIDEKRGTISNTIKNIGIAGHFEFNHLPIITAHSRKSDFNVEKMISRANEQGFVVVQYDREQDTKTQILNKKFREYFYGNDLGLNITSMYGNKPKSTPDYLKEHKIDTFEKLKNEHQLIKNKKSQLSSKIRLMVEKAYEIVTKPEN